MRKKNQLASDKLLYYPSVYIIGYKRKAMVRFEITSMVTYRALFHVPLQLLFKIQFEITL